MHRYPRQPSQIERARRSGAFLFGTVALLAIGFAELNLRSIAELGTLIIAVYAAIVVISSAVARVFAEQYFRSASTLFGAPPVIAVPIYSLGLGFMAPILLFTAIGDAGFSYFLSLIAITAAPVILIGGAVATFLMRRWYGRND